MLDEFRSRWGTLRARVRRVERRELREFRAWMENTRNLVHLTVLVVVPVLLAAVTALSNAVDLVPFVLFPPLASGTYTLFSDPEGRYASPVRFVGGLTAGAACGGVAFVVSATMLGTPPAASAGEFLGSVSPLAAALAVFLTGAFTWAFDVEEPSAFSTALLALVAPAEAAGGASLAGAVGQYVGGVFVASAVVAAAFSAWRSQVYEQRARYLYASIKGDDHVLVPMRGDHPDATAMLGARLAAAHDAGKVVLLDVVDDEAVARAERALLDDGHRAPAASDAERDEAPADLAEDRAVAEAATALEERANHIETAVGVPCQVVVAVGDADRAGTVLETAREANCDLVAAPYEERHGRLSPFVRELFRGDVDVLVHRSAEGRTAWTRILVPVRHASDVAHAMIDFARRLAGATGRITVCHCLGDSGDLRRAERMLADLVETFSGDLETRVSRAAIEDFLANNAAQFDLVLMGASTDRTAASRFVSPPTFERIHELDCDVAILDRVP